MVETICPFDGNAWSAPFLVVGDYIEMTVFQTSGGALNLNSGASYSPEFWATWTAL